MGENYDNNTLHMNFGDENQKDKYRQHGRNKGNVHDMIV